MLNAVVEAKKWRWVTSEWEKEEWRSRAEEKGCGEAQDMLRNVSSERGGEREGGKGDLTKCTQEAQRGKGESVIFGSGCVTKLSSLSFFLFLLFLPTFLFPRKSREFSKNHYQRFPLSLSLPSFPSAVSVSLLFQAGKKFSAPFVSLSHPLLLFGNVTEEHEMVDKGTNNTCNVPQFQQHEFQRTRVNPVACLQRIFQQVCSPWNEYRQLIEWRLHCFQSNLNTTLLEIRWKARIWFLSFFEWKMWWSMKRKRFLLVAGEGMKIRAVWEPISGWMGYEMRRKGWLDSH